MPDEPLAQDAPVGTEGPKRYHLQVDYNGRAFTCESLEAVPSDGLLIEQCVRRLLDEVAAGISPDERARGFHVTFTTLAANIIDGEKLAALLNPPIPFIIDMGDEVIGL